MKKKFTFLLAMTASLGSFAQWGPDNSSEILVSNQLRTVYSWDFFIDHEKENIMLGLSGPHSGTTCSFFTRYDKDGNALYDEAQLVSDFPTMTWVAFGQFVYKGNDGCMYMAVQNLKNATDLGLVQKGSSLLNCNLHKITPDGELPWGDEGVDLNRGGYALNLQAAHSMAQLTDGSVMAAWTDWKYVALGDDNFVEIPRIMIERVSADGEMVWDEPVVIEDDDIYYSYPYLIDAGDNQVLMVYLKGSRQDIYVRKIDFDGASVWTEDVKVYQGGFGSIPVWTFLRVISDGEGGCIISWYDDRYMSQLDQTYVAHVTSEGKHGYASGVGGEAVGYSEYLRSLGGPILYDKESKNLYVMCREYTNGIYRIMMQKMASTGELMWGDEGVDVVSEQEYAVSYFDLEFAEDGNVVAFYMMNENIADGAAVMAYAQKYDAETGEPMWDEPVEITTLYDGRNDRAALQVSELVNNEYWVAMWTDTRVVTESDEDAVTSDRKKLYMQRINVDGKVGEPTAIEIVNSDCIADIRVEDGNVIAPQGAKVYNINGVEVGSENLSAGIYIVRNGNEARKVIVK